MSAPTGAMVDAHGRPLPGVLRILVVCTGNICRSPMAERIARAELVRLVGQNARWVSVTSAGTGALVDERMDVGALATLAGRGVVDVDDFRARQLTRELVAEADLVLTAERYHRGYAVDLMPEVVRRAFTLRELDRLLADVDPADIAPGTPRNRGLAIAATAASLRGQVPYVEPEEDDILDPYRRPLIEFERAAAELSRALARPLGLLTGVAP